MKHLLLLAALVGCQAAPDGASELLEADVEASEPLAGPSFDALADADLAPASAERLAAPTAAMPGVAPAQDAAPAAGDAGPARAAFDGRSLRRTADLALTVESFDATLRQARAVAGRYGGLVTGEDGHADGAYATTTLTLRVPSSRFDAALDALAALGTVDRRAVTVDDVTAQVVDLDARIRAKRAAEARYVALVGQARTIDETMSVQGRLDGVRAEIEQMESAARALRGSVALSTIRATFTAAGAVAPLPPGVVERALAGVAAGWHGVLAVVLGVLPLWPVAALAGAGYAVWRRLQPRLAASRVATRS